ncbi:zinc finger protein 800b isoform X2 [Betta splendens]|uniref:Zinc finger protein 800b isoform X2 n=1 Tax=Betta splendens TaxID=158456 RepID=A0A9W2Y1T0_BETSP|nr:zinc finger protein 800b isoform X2 [Betta splendens]
MFNLICSHASVTLLSGGAEYRGVFKWKHTLYTTFVSLCWGFRRATTRLYDINCVTKHLRVCAGTERVAQQASLGSMVKAQKSSGRKSSHCLRRQNSGQMETEEGQSDTQHPTQMLPQEGDQSSDQIQLPTTASGEPLLENWVQKDAPMNVQEKADPAAQTQPQAKPLWRPIPPLLPERCHYTTIETRDQSCQTDETSHGHNTGVCVEPGDPPLLQQPLQTSKSGIQQIIECFRSGTSQLKHMLLREVDTIFECKVCRSLFRGLPNLITHKEYYCLSRLPDSDGSPGDDRQSVAVKDLLDTIYPRADRPDYVVRLEPIQTTTKAVYQYITTEEELTKFPSRTPSARESPVAWTAEPVEGEDNNQTSQPGGQDGDSSPGPNPGQRRWEPEEETKEDQPQPEEEEATSGVEDVTISCCLCGQDFNSRRSIRRHCRKMHQTKLEELRKFTETRTVPTSLLSMVKGGRPRTLSTPTGKSCPVCLKTFATKANVRRHFDEVHRGLRRDTITPSIASRPGPPFSLEVTPPRKSNNASPTRGQNSKTTPSNQNQSKPQNQLPASPQTNPTSCRCTLCKRNYSSQLMLKRHMRIVHKVYSIKSNRSGSTNDTQTTPNSSSTNTSSSNNVRVKEEAVERSDEDDEDNEEEEELDSSSAPSPSDSTGTPKGASAAQNPLKVKEEEPPSSPKVATSSSSSSSRGGNMCSGGMAAKMTKLSVGFDFKQLFCKLCKRQFSSRQNLTKHIELHTDGNDIFIKFYRCPLCRYESRRKRDVLRHVTVVHKKSSAYLAKIMPKLESRAVKRLAEAVLNSAYSNKRTGAKEEVNGRHAPSSSSSSPSHPVTRKQECSAAAPASSAPSSPAPPPAPVTRKQQELSSLAFNPSPPVTRKQERQQIHRQRSVSPPLTRRSEKHTQQRHSSALPNNQPPHTRRHDAQDSTETSSTEVRVTKNFSLHACDQCGRAFAKKLYLESHKRSHRNAVTTAASRRKGVSTRSKSLVW